MTEELIWLGGGVPGLLSIRSIVNTLIFLYLVLKPFYFWGSGLPQIADISLVLLVIIALFKVKIPRKTIPHGSFALTSLLFLFYVIFVNSIWYIVLDNESSLIFNNLFYIFNIFAMLAILYLYYQNSADLFKIIYYGTTISIFMQCLLYFIMDDGGIRNTNFFNNPNQLAYYTLLCLAYILIVDRKINIKAHMFILAVLGCFFLIFTTSSQGAIASAIFMFVVYIFVSKKKGMVRFFNWSTAIFSLVFLYLLVTGSALLNNRSKIIDTFIWRFNKSTIDSGEGFIIERGYDRIINHPEYWIFGAGEGVHDRFISFANYELHSTLGTVFFSYGIIGLLLFSMIFLYIFRKSRWVYAYPLIAVMIYGLSHNGLRNSMLWIMFALLITAASKVKVTEVNKVFPGKKAV